MKNILIAIIVLLLAWFAYTQMKGQKKPESNAVTRYAEGLKSSEDKAKEAAGTANLAIVRAAIVQFKGSQGRYPDSLQELVSKGYVDRVPEVVSYDKDTGEVK